MVKNLDDFSYSPRGVASRNSYCKVCMRERSKASYRKRLAAAGRAVREPRVLADGERWCADCETAKPLDQFPRNRSDPSGHGSYCKPCYNERGRESRERLHGGSREYHLRHRYGIGQREVDQMIAEQLDTCAACRKAKPEHVDHDHATGKVRGLLCFNCNQALGNIRDDVYAMRGLIRYLDAHNYSRGRPAREEHDLRPLSVVYGGRIRPCGTRVAMRFR